MLQAIGEVLRRNGAPNLVDPLRRLLPTIGLSQQYGFTPSSVGSLALQALQVRPAIYLEESLDHCTLT